MWTIAQCGILIPTTKNLPRALVQEITRSRARPDISFLGKPLIQIYHPSSKINKIFNSIIITKTIYISLDGGAFTDKVENDIPLTCTVWTILNPYLNHRSFNCLAYNPTSGHSSSSDLKVIHTHVRQSCGLWFFGGGFLFHFYLIFNSKFPRWAPQTVNNFLCRGALIGYSKVYLGCGLSPPGVHLVTHDTWLCLYPIDGIANVRYMR